MPRPHKHPSEHCYSSHGCRCPGCTLEHTETTRRWRENKRRREGKPFVGVKAPDIRRGRPQPLDPETLVKLRLAVGLNPDGTERK